MAGRDHQAAAGPEPPDRTGHRRGGAETQVENLAASSGETGRQGRHQHRAAGAGIAADHHRPTSGKHLAAPVTQLQGQQGRDQLPHPAADAIGAEVGLARRQRLADRKAGPVRHAPQCLMKTLRLSTCRKLAPHRQRRGHQAQQSSSHTPHNSSAPTSQPGSNTTGP